MTQVTVYINRRARVMGYAAIGHTLYAQEGEDIVCASVSTLTQSTVNALYQVARVTPRVLRKPGLLIVRIAKTSGMRWHDSQVLLQAFVRNTAQLAEQFPEYVRLRFKIDESYQSDKSEDKRRKEVKYGHAH
ncbi:hypothetical protein FACS1894184_02830 [Clostridia bacterium]|nr:hypothetical protein FACS1894184_02830 [Clostridia bacterium]